MTRTIENLTRTDFTLTVDNSIALLTPLTPEADEWCNNHLPDDAPMFGCSYAIENRHVEPILAGINDAGLNF